MPITSSLKLLGKTKFPPRAGTRAALLFCLPLLQRSSPPTYHKLLNDREPHLIQHPTKAKPNTNRLQILSRRRYLTALQTAIWWAIPPVMRRLGSSALATQRSRFSLPPHLPLERTPWKTCSRRTIKPIHSRVSSKQVSQDYKCPVVELHRHLDRRRVLSQGVLHLR